MTLFPESVLHDLRRIPGARHSFIRHLAQADGAPARAFLDDEASRVPSPLRERWRELLVSLDNRRFAQGYGEVAAMSKLRPTGWTVETVRPPGPVIQLRDPTGGIADLVVLSFVRQTRPIADAEVVSRLTRAIDRLGARSRVAVVVRKWLPHDFNPEPIRRAINLWLQEVDRGGWDGRYAAYEDEHVSLEFALTGARTTEGSGVVAFTLPPLDALSTLEHVERQLHRALDAWRHSRRGDHPVLVACVADQPWRLPRGYLREMLLGKPVATTTGPDGYRVHYGIEQSPSLLRDPIQRHVQGVLFIDRAISAPEQVTARGYLNPWSHPVRDPDQLGFPCLAMSRREDDGPVMRWFNQTH